MNYKAEHSLMGFFLPCTVAPLESSTPGKKELKANL